MSIRVDPRPGQYTRQVTGVRLRRVLAMAVQIGLAVQVPMGTSVNLNATMPAADLHRGLGWQFDQGLSNSPASLVAHATLGTITLLLAVIVVASSEFL